MKNGLPPVRRNRRPPGSGDGAGSTSERNSRSNRCRAEPASDVLHELERDVAAVARVAGAVDDAHAPLAELAADLEPLVPQLGDVVAIRH